MNGNNRYRLRVPASGIPTDSFWSLSMYERNPDGRMFFAANSIRRYSVGDRTPGLARNANGTLDIWLQHATPDEESSRANWLPAPAGPFVIVLRAYLPRAELREGLSAIPSITRQ